MNLGSPEKGLEEMSDLEKEDQYAVVGELDLNFAMDKEEKAEDYVYENLARSNKIQVDLNEQGHLGSPSLPADFGYDTLESPFEESHSPVQTGFDHDVAMRTNFVYDQERLQSPLKDNHFEEEMEEVRDSHFCKSSSQVKADSFHNEMGTEGFSHSAEFPSTKDSNRGGELEDHSNLDMPSSPLRDGKVKETFSEKLQYGLTKSAYEEVEEEATDHQTGKMFPSPRSRRGDSETKNKNFYHSRNSPTESRKLDIPHSGQDSPGRTPRRSKSLVTVRQMSFSPERPPSTHQCPSGQNPSSPKHDVQDLSYSSGSDWQKHSPLPERSDLGKGVPSKDNLLPSARRNSASPRRSRQGYHHKDGSSLKHVSTSQRTRYSPPNHRRQDRSLSRSPVRRRDSSSGYKRDYRDRSRSRSPYAIHRHRRSPRRRYSPRHRSPASGYHSHRRSPRRRPWSPPPNRSTGVGKPGKNLFVAGFSFLTTEKDLERKFSRFGRVRDVRIVRDKRVPCWLKMRVQYLFCCENCTYTWKLRIRT